MMRFGKIHFLLSTMKKKIKTKEKFLFNDGGEA